MVTVGIGMDLDMTELETVATAADNNFITQIQSFAGLEYIVAKVAASTCLGKTFSIISVIYWDN